jgi:polyhydroxyalkanoate synthase subunit PhaC
MTAVVTDPRSSLEDRSYAFDLSGGDPVGLQGSLREAMAANLRSPLKLGSALSDLAIREFGVGLDAVRTALGVEEEPPVSPAAGDRRFADRAWRSNAVYRSTLGSYLVLSRWLEQLVDAAELPEPKAKKARFGLRLLLDMAAPSNLPWLNPTVLKEAIDTGGLSLARGFGSFVHDLARNGGQPVQVDASSFEVGRNLAATPGRVVYHNDLMELLMYEAQTETVFRNPIICSPPWINKYYVMDLAPGRSFVEYAVSKGHTVFMISYRNPDASMRDYTFDDYLSKGLLAAIEKALEITGAEKANLVGLCLGGTLTALGLGYLSAQGKADKIGWVTLTNSLVDFSEPGDLGVFTDENTIASLEKRMSEKGYLDSSAMAGTFNWLRGNDLIWSYVVNNWYLGKKPAALDMLAWNADSTNMPAAMHSGYLRACYLNNELSRPGAFSILGEPINLGKVKVPMYILSAEADHIAPWRGAYRSTQIFGGDIRFTLTSSGHIAGIVNPLDNPKSYHFVRDGVPADPEQWFAGAKRRTGSWWTHWLEWSASRSGDQVPARRLPPGEAAPGRYVLNLLPSGGRLEGRSAKPVKSRTATRRQAPSGSR